ncbi:MAG: 5-carboxymethyl-2-hydroxymuconate isomerase [Yoonia sp.]|jgi:5-carboxymethyl-2-hydroxymuconate isomerase
MPHVILEYSKNVTQTGDISVVCGALFDALSAHPAFTDPKAIKIRATQVDHFQIGSEPHSFVHATLLLLHGRDEATRANINQTILAVLEDAFADVGSLSVLDRAIDPATYAKRVL